MVQAPAWVLSRTAEEAQAALEADLPLNQPTRYPKRTEKQNVLTKDPPVASWIIPPPPPEVVERPGMVTAPRNLTRDLRVPVGPPLAGPPLVAEPAGAGRAAPAKRSLVVFAPRRKFGAADWDTG